MKAQRGPAVAISLAFALTSTPTTMGQGSSDDLWVSEPASPVVIDRTLLDLDSARRWHPGDPIRPVNSRRITNPQALQRKVPTPEGQPDPLLQRQIAVEKAADKTFTAPDVNVDGQGFSGSFPPDTIGEVGTTHYIQMINSGSGGSLVQAYDKATGAAVLGAPPDLTSLAPPGNPCASGSGDPVPLYDQLADRWILTEFVDEGVGNHLCAYVSSGADPTTSTWMLYRFDTPFFPDYPKYGVWPDAYYIGTNEAGVTAVYALDRAQMLSGGVATMIRRTTSQLPGFGFQVLAPVDIDGNSPPPAGSPGIFIRHRDDESHDNSPVAGSDHLEVFEFAANFGNPASSTLGGPIDISVAEYESDLCGLFSFECFRQPGTQQGLDPLREPVMHRPVYRNFGSHQALVGNFVTDVDGGSADRGGIRWFELRRAGGTASGGWTLFQEGTVSAADGLSRWMASIAMDQAGNMALGYSTSGPGAGQFPSIRYTGRESGDPLGTMPQAETVIVAGGASQTDAERWGDYSAMTIDPNDDCTFWYTNQYVPAGNMNLWSTRLASFSFSSCNTPGNVLSVTRSGAGNGTVTSTPAGINCGSDCSESYTAGTEVELTATPAAGSVFAGWSGACTGTGACRITMNSDRSVTARFDTEGGSDCAGAICLNGERFQVDVSWRTPSGETGVGEAIPGSPADDSGVLFFFSANNWEMLIKVLDGCDITQHFWVFAAATTDVEYTLTVTDTLTGASKSYSNPQGTAAAAITDTEALDVCDAGGLTSAPEQTAAAPPSIETTQVAKQAVCTEGDDRLCLNRGRFQVEVDWETNDEQGPGLVVPFGSDDSGLFYFFSANNWEMLVKVLDGCDINQSYWVFAAATTNVGYTLRVTDTDNGVMKTYTNAIGTASPAINDTAAFATCKQ